MLKGIFKAKNIFKSIECVAMPGRIICFLVMPGRFMPFTSIVGICIVKMVVVRHDIMSHIKQDHASQQYEYVVLSFQESANIVF